VVDLASSPRLPYAATAVDGSARVALGRLGDALRRPGAEAWAGPLMLGDPVDRGEFDRRLGPDVANTLIGAGLAAEWGSELVLAVVIADIGGVLTAVPKFAWGDEIVYFGQDSSYLVEAVVRLAPRGERAAELGTGTGLLAVVLGWRYRTVVATDLARSVTAAADVTLALNPAPDGHAVGVCVADVARGLRPGAFDLVVANAPWVPLASDVAAPRELFAHGGDDGVALPRRFLLEGAPLLRPGGVAITLALDVELVGDRRPLLGVCEQLRADGFVVAVLPTPFNRDRPRLPELMAERQPSVTAAVHVAVVVARPADPSDRRESLMVAAEALRRRWEASPTAGGDPL